MSQPNTRGTKSQRSTRVFRAEALARLQSPDRLDELLRLESPRTGLAVALLAATALGLLVWSIFGRIPEKVMARGAVLHPRKVVGFQSVGSGKVRALNVSTGSVVEKGTVLAIIDQPELTRQLELGREKLTKLRQQTHSVASLRQEAGRIETLSVQQQREAAEQRIRDAREMGRILKDSELEAVRQQRTALDDRKRLAEELGVTLKDRAMRYRALKAAGDVRLDEVIAAEAAYQGNLSEVANIHSQLKQIRIREIEADRSYREQLSKVTGYQLELKEATLREKRMEQQSAEASVNAETQIADAEREVSRLEVQLGNDSNIVSPGPGTVLEVEVSVGQVVSPGQRLGKIQQSDADKPMESVSFVSLGDGNKVRPGMEVFVVPDGVERERFGSIRGRVVTVSPFPVTLDEATSIVGNREVATQLTSERNLVVVGASLELDPAAPSGYRWTSSRGPQLRFAPGTTTTIFITIEQRAPVTFVLPFLRSSSGTY